MRLRRLACELALVLLPAAILGLAWELAVMRSSRAQFLFASPSLVVKRLLEYVAQGDAVVDTWVTASEAFVGFLAGNAIGVIVGIALAYYPTVQRIAKWYILALGAIPIFSLAPMMIMWFGIGYVAKVMMSIFSTVLVTTGLAYAGATSGVEGEYVRLLRSFGASRQQVFLKVVVPSALSWVVASFRLTVGFALLGAFIGEFISAERGLGYRILRAGGTYDTPLVLAGITLIVVLALLLSKLVDLVGWLLLRGLRMKWVQERNALGRMG